MPSLAEYLFGYAEPKRGPAAASLAGEQTDTSKSVWANSLKNARKPRTIDDRVAGRLGSGAPSALGPNGLDETNAAIGRLTGLLGAPSGDEAGNLAALDAAQRGTAINSPERMAFWEAAYPYFMNAATIRAYHGSPHDFTKFDMSKMGTGEGAQAYGHGLYFAEEPAVAKNYAPRDMEYEQRLLKMYQNAERLGQYDKMEVYEAAMLHQTPSELRGMFPDKKYAGAIDDVVANKAKGTHLYTVDIDANPEDFLDWDKPLSQQPAAAQRVFKRLGFSDDKTVGDLYAAASEQMSAKRGKVGINADHASRQYLAKNLRKAGVKGIRYQDAGSRGGDAGTYNYVVFDDNLVNIVGKE